MNKSMCVCACVYAGVWGVWTCFSVEGGVEGDIFCVCVCAGGGGRVDVCVCARERACV